MVNKISRQLKMASQLLWPRYQPAMAHLISQGTVYKCFKVFVFWSQYIYIIYIYMPSRKVKWWWTYGRVVFPVDQLICRFVSSLFFFFYYIPQLPSHLACLFSSPSRFLCSSSRWGLIIPSAAGLLRSHHNHTRSVTRLIFFFCSPTTELLVSHSSFRLILDVPLCFSKGNTRRDRLLHLPLGIPSF